MTKRLELVFPEDDGTQTYQPGIEGVDSIERVQGGYAVNKGTLRITIHDHRVRRFVEVGRPGVADEPESGESRYGLQRDGVWVCRACGTSTTEKGKPLTTLHALKIHYGKAHGEA